MFTSCRGIWHNKTFTCQKKDDILMELHHSALINITYTHTLRLTKDSKISKISFKSKRESFIVRWKEMENNC